MVGKRELWKQPFRACAIDADCAVKPDVQNSVISFAISKWLLQARRIEGSGDENVLEYETILCAYSENQVRLILVPSATRLKMSLTNSSESNKKFDFFHWATRNGCEVEMKITKLYASHFFVGGAVAFWLVGSSSDRAVQVQALAGDIVLLLGQETLLSQWFYPPRCINRCRRI